MRFKFFIRMIPVLVAIAVCAAAVACIHENEEPEVSLEPGDPLPDFTITMLDGEVFSTADLAGSPLENLYLVFFNTDCSDCRRELPQIQTFYEELEVYPTTRLICIAREEDAESIIAFWNENSLTMPVSPQPDRRIYNLFATTGIPRIYHFRRSSPSWLLVDLQY